MKRFILLMALFCFQEQIAQNTTYRGDREKLLDFAERLRPIVPKKYKSCKNCFAIDLSELKPKNKSCVSGDCDNGSGTLMLKPDLGKYVGEFVNSLPHGKGYIVNAVNDTLHTEFSEGQLNGQQWIRGVKGNRVFLTSTWMYPSRVENMYWPDYDAFYSGSINPRLEAYRDDKRNSRLVSKHYDLRVVYSDSRERVVGFKGKIFDKKRGFYVDSHLDLNLRPVPESSATITFPTKTDTVYTQTNENGFDTWWVRVKYQNGVYQGETDENWLPHGKGVLVLDGEKISAEKWVHGKKMDGTREFFNTYAKNDSEYELLVAALYKRLRQDYPFARYMGFAKNEIEFKAGPWGYASIMFINTTQEDKTIRLDIKDGFLRTWDALIKLKIKPNGDPTMYNKKFKDLTPDQTYTLKVSGQLEGVFMVIE